MGRMTRNLQLFYDQFEHEVIPERVRDEVAASNPKCIWMGGTAFSHRWQWRKFRWRERKGPTDRSAKPQVRLFCDIAIQAGEMAYWVGEGGAAVANRLSDTQVVVRKVGAKSNRINPRNEIT